MRRALQFVSTIALGLALAVPVAAFVKLSGMLGHTTTIAVAAAPPGQWHPTPPLVIFSNQSNYGWATTKHPATPTELQLLYLIGVLPYVPPPLPPLPPLPPSLTSMPTTGWTLDNGATITTDSNGVLVLRPLTSGQPSLPGQGQGWRGAYWYPARTAHWHNYTLGVTITNLGGQGSGANATVVVGYGVTHNGYAVSISAARITIQNPSGAHIFNGVIHSANTHRVVVTLSKRLSVSVDGASVASFPVSVRGGIGFGTWKATVNSNLPFFRSLTVGSS
jgi:hypothetical protein